VYQQIINRVVMMVHELENKYKKLFEKLHAKLDDIFEPTIKINIGLHKIAALCDFSASVSTISKNLFKRLRLRLASK
jgi:hypothetical protein